MSVLPKIPVSVVEITIPSTKKKMKFSRLRVNEEKILLIAKQSGEASDILTAIKDVINSCAQEPTFDVNTLASFDIEYLFLKLHAASVSNIAKINIHDPEDDQDYKFDVDLNTVEIDDKDRKEPNIKVTDEIVAHFLYPPATMYGDKEILKSKDPNFDIMLKCLDKIYDGDTVIETKSVPKNEFLEWVKSFPYDVNEKVQEFFNNAPHLSHTIKYKNSKGTERTFVLSTLADFFML